MTLILLALWSSSSAWAICDWDGDGFGGFHWPTCPVPQPDCDDADAGVNPAEPEVMADLVDNDCDDLTDVIQRPYFAGFWGGTHPEWTYGMGTWGNAELVHVAPGGALILNGAIPWKSGQPNSA